ncbi:hypothetical protein [Candidatus Methanomethylophilus sp. 1R26]|nr:hypothetical protein [Candidatus Methanomethylophilus sp. 1R26]
MKGAPVRIIEPSERTAFAYRIEGGMDARDSTRSRPWTPGT